VNGLQHLCSLRQMVEKDIGFVAPEHTQKSSMQRLDVYRSPANRCANYLWPLQETLVDLCRWTPASSRLWRGAATARRWPSWRYISTMYFAAASLSLLKCCHSLQVDAGIIETLVRDGYIPVLATVASSPTGESLNVNADIAAGEVRCWHPPSSALVTHSP